MSKSIIQENETLRLGLKNRFVKLELTLKKVANDASSYGININIHSLSKYLTKSKKTNLTEDTIIWLSFRYGVYVNLIVGTPKIEDNKLKSSITDYDEKRCLKFLQIKYPKRV